jgi:hypothetical protein
MFTYARGVKPPPFDDPRLGSWRYEEGFWISDRVQGDARITLTVKGVDRPDPALAIAALEALDKLDDLRKQIEDQLSEFLSHCKPPVHRPNLLIEEICFTRNPDHGMLFMSAGTDSLSWRCDVVNMQIRHLDVDI